MRGVGGHKGSLGKAVMQSVVREAIKGTRSLYASRQDDGLEKRKRKKRDTTANCLGYCALNRIAGSEI